MPQGQSCPTPSTSSGPVNYGTGQIVYSETDLTANAFGIAWGHTRSYANVLVGTGGNGSSLNGNRWYVSQLRALAFQYTVGEAQPSRVVVVEGANSSEYFNLVDGGYQNEFVGWDSLVWDETAQEFVLTQAGNGQQWAFFDQTTAAELRGQLKRVVDPAGRIVNYNYDLNGNLESFEQFEDGQTSGFYYTWTAMNSIASVSLKLDDHLVRRVRFDYYAFDETGGNLDDLKSVIIEQYDKGTDDWRVVAQKHYRYYLEGDAHGFASGLKLVIGAGAYQLMLDGGLNPETATETELLTYADFYYEYDADKRVTLERLEGGRRQYSFAYTTNSDHHSDSGANVWLTKTVETLPDGSVHRVYTNDGYNMLVKILHQVGTGDQWVDYWTYTDEYKPLLHANPSAVESVTEPSGSSTTLTVHLRTAAGLIEVTSYYTADDFPSGKVEGYVFTRGVQKGSGGGTEVVEKLRYATQTVGGQNLHTISEQRVYPVAGMSDADAPTTTYERTYYNDGSDATFQVLELITTVPMVSEDENGSGVAGVSKQVYDRFGRVTWQMNERGVISYTSYVQATGAILQHIEDVNTTLLPDPPSGWVAYGEHLITDYVSDAQGRVVQERGPWHEVQLSEWDTTTTAIRRVTFTTYDDEAHEVRNASGYLTGNNPTPTFTVVGAVSRQISDSNGRVVDEIQAVRCCPTGPLTPGEALPQEKWSRWTHRIYDPWGRLYAQRVYHRIPAQGDGEEIANYLETIYGYDAMGRQNRVVDPAGNIRRTVYDVRDQVVSQWGGTDDTSATNSDPTGGGATGNNMVIVQLLEYDDGEAGGDGNMTQQTLPVDATSGHDRITLYGYDYRDRRETTTQTDGTTTWITKATYDNLNRVTASVRYHASVSNANRLAQSRTYYDALGRVFKTETDGIDPATGDVTGTLTGLNWYDLVGNVIKQSQPGNTAFTKTVYDELNRPTAAYLCCRPGESGVPSGDDNSVVDDTVIEQSNTVYDRGGNVIRQTQKQRFDDATGTGVLNGPQTEPKSRDTYGMTWPDALGRPRVSADYGTNGGSMPTRPDVAPARSDTILVTTNRYKDSGDANAIIDPMGIETRWENDQAGRRIKLIEGIAPGQGAGMSSSPTSACSNAPYPPHPTPRVTQFCWHPSGQLSKLILVNAETGDQSTRWLFGTTLSNSAIASNSLVRTKIYPESDDRPAPAADGPDGIYSRLEYSYNRQGQQTVFKDADGTTHAYDYDKMGNITADRVTVLAAGLDDAVLRIGTTYDVRGLTAKVTSYDAATSGSVVNEVAFEYDSFQQIAADKQSHAGAVGGSTPKVTYSYESGGTTNSARRTATTYPTSSRVVGVQYGASNSMDDHLSRVSALQVTGETDELVSYTYCGQAWQVRVGYPAPGVELKYRRLSGEPVGDAGDVYSGYDRFGRTVDMPWVKTGDGSVVERSQYGFDRASRRTWQKRPQTDTQDQQYSYDALSQVSAAARGSLNLNATAISGTPASAESWDYDPTGNWRGYHAAANGTSTLDQHRVHDRGNRLTQIEDNPNNMLLDRVGRIRQMAPDADGDWDGALELAWDAWSRITSVKSNGEVVGDYAYDGKHRRITRVVDGVTLHSYYNDAWRPVEERKDSATIAAMSYLWGARFRDDLARRDRAVGGTTLNETRYVLMDYFNPAAITDGTGVVKERYAFSAFGLRTILNPDFTERSSSECGLEFAFQGQFLDGESGLMNYGYRYYSPQLGRWTCKDPIGEKGGLNLYEMASNNSINLVDLLGLDPPGKGVNSCCNGKNYDSLTHCCVKGAIFSLEEKATGVFRIIGCKPGNLAPEHSWIEYPGGSAGFFPGPAGNYFGEPGMVLSPDPYAIGQGSAQPYKEEVKLSECDYDLEKFVSCVSGFAADYPQDTQYNAGMFDCRHWSLRAITSCLEKAKR